MAFFGEGAKKKDLRGKQKKQHDKTHEDKRHSFHFKRTATSIQEKIPFNLEKTFILIHKNSQFSSRGEHLF